jgi:TRAP-type C4-dicarboxylate transport system substrate-binding protein
MAAFASGYFPTQFPFWRMPNGTPFVMASIEEAIQTAIRLPQQVPAIQEEIRKQNIKLLYSHVMPGFHLFARKPVEKFEGLKGLKVRTYGDILPKILHAANAVGVNVFPGEVYEALQKGVIDGGLFDLGGGYGPKVHEVAPHINLWNIMSIVAWGVWINQDTWNKLPADIQQVMLDVSKESVQFERNRAITFENKSKEMLKKEGAIFHEVSTVERQKWINVSPNFLEEFIKAMAKQGKENEAIQFKKSWLEIIDKY